MTRLPAGFLTRRVLQSSELPFRVIGPLIPLAPTDATAGRNRTRAAPVGRKLATSTVVHSAAAELLHVSTILIGDDAADPPSGPRQDQVSLDHLAHRFKLERDEIARGPVNC